MQLANCLIVIQEFEGNFFMKVIRNYLYNASYQLLLVLLPLVTATYISRVLGNAGVGINAYTSSIISYFVLFANVGINLYGNRQIAYLRNDRKKNVTSLLGNYIVKNYDSRVNFHSIFMLSAF